MSISKNLSFMLIAKMFMDKLIYWLNLTINGAMKSILTSLPILLKIRISVSMRIYQKTSAIDSDMDGLSHI